MNNGITEIIQVLTDNHARNGIFEGMIGLVTKHERDNYTFGGQACLSVQFPMIHTSSFTVMIHLPKYRMDFNLVKVHEEDEISVRLIGQMNSDITYLKKSEGRIYLHGEDDRANISFTLPEITSIPTPGFFGMKPGVISFDCSGAMAGQIAKPLYETKKELTDEDILKTLTKDQLKALRIREAKARRRDYDISSVKPILNTFDENQRKLADKLTNRATNTNLSYLKIRKIIYNNPATIVIWNDGTKTVTKVGKDQEFSEYFGLLAAIAKRIYETNGEIDREIQAKREYGNKKEKAVKTEENPVDNALESFHEAAVEAAAKIVAGVLSKPDD